MCLTAKGIPALWVTVKCFYFTLHFYEFEFIPNGGPERAGSLLHNVSFTKLLLMAHLIGLTSQLTYSVGGMRGYVNILPND